MQKLILALLVAAFAAVTTSHIFAADDAKPTEKKEAPVRAIPLRGKVDAIDKQAKTFKINERTFHVTAETRIMKDGKPGTFDEASVGQDVTGAYREGADKRLNVVSLRIGATPAVPAKPVAPAK